MIARLVRTEERKKGSQVAEDFVGHAETRGHFDREHEILAKMPADLGVLAK